jgi:hypothetical protein
MDGQDEERTEQGRGEKQPVEYWAEQAGMYPQYEESGVTVIAGQILQQRRENPRFIEFVQAKALKGWPVGAEVTREEFDAAVAEAQGGVIR